MFNRKKHKTWLPEIEREQDFLCKAMKQSLVSLRNKTTLQVEHCQWYGVTP